MCKVIPPSLFFGGLLIIGGILFIVKNYVQFRIPVFSILFALFLIWLGICLLVRSPESQRVNAAATERLTTSFRDESITLDGEIKGNAYDLSFGQLSIDMKKAKAAKGGATIKLSCAFGNMDVYGAKDLPIKVIGSVAFGNLVVSDKQTAGIDGKLVYESPSYKAAANKIDIYADCSFGSLRIRD